MIRFAAGFGLLLGLAAPAAAATYAVDYGKSTVGFSGTHAGEVFTGKFGAWQAEIVFDPADLGASHLAVSFDTGSAATGDALRDGTLPQPDWFDVKDFPSASFTSSKIAAGEGGGYVATGTLTIRGQSREVSLPFTLTDFAKPPVTAKASLHLDRLAFGMGAQSDPKAEWVGRQIDVTVEVVASPTH